MKSICKKNNLSLIIVIIIGVLNPLRAQNSRSDDAKNSKTNDGSWSWTIDDNDNQNLGFFRWWANGGNGIEDMLMELYNKSGNTILKVPTSVANSVLSLNANDLRAPSYETVYPFIFLQTGSAKASIFYGKDHMLNFAIDPRSPDSSSSYSYSNGFRFFNSKGANITDSPSSYGDELMRISKDGNVGIATENPTQKLDVNGVAMFRNGNDYSGILKDQIQFGWKNSVNYKHTIRTRHNAYRDAGNAIDFYTWNQGTDAVGGSPSTLNMSLNGGNVGVGVLEPTKKLDVAGDINFTGHLYKNGSRINLNKSVGDIIGRKIVVQNGQNGGTDKGIYMWREDDTNWGIYMGPSGGGRSLSGGNAPSSERITSHAVRFRAYDYGNSGVGGFIFENSSNEALASINSSDGLAKFKQVKVEGLSFISDDVRLGTGSGSGITASGAHVFIGNDAGNKSGFDAISVIDYEDDANTNPVTGTEYLQNHSVFVLNNKSDLEKPLLFGNFAKSGDSNSLAQLAINTHHVVKDAALTISGAVHIGPKNIDPSVFPPNDAYDEALLWVEEGIVTEDMIYAHLSDWNDWPDYVFEKNYDLMSLDKLNEFIHKEKHLPGIPSREDLKKEGLSSKQIVADLLLKIEELTLYTIDQEKKIERQKQINEDLIKRLSVIEEKLNDQ